MAMRRTLAGMAALPEHQREAVLRMAVQGRSQADVAQALGLSHGAVAQLVLRARRTLRAAATTLTPQGLLQWLSTLGSEGHPAAARIAELAGGAGGGAVGLSLGKLAAIVAVAGTAATGPALTDHRDDSAAAARGKRTGSFSSSRSGSVAIAPGRAVPPIEPSGRGGRETRGPSSGDRGSGSSGPGPAAPSPAARAPAAPGPAAPARSAPGRARAAPAERLGRQRLGHQRLGHQRLERPAGRAPAVGTSGSGTSGSGSSGSRQRQRLRARAAPASRGSGQAGPLSGSASGGSERQRLRTRAAPVDRLGSATPARAAPDPSDAGLQRPDSSGPTRPRLTSPRPSDRHIRRAALSKCVNATPTSAMS